MVSTISSTTSSSLATAIDAHALPRGMKRPDMPFRSNNVVDETETRYEVVDDAFRLVVDRTCTGADGALALRTRLVPDENEAKEDVPKTADGKGEGEGEGDDTGTAQGEELADSKSGEEAGDHRDILAWIAKGDGDAFVRVEDIPGDRVMVVVASDEVTEAAILDLAASMARAIVIPFKQHGTRQAWKSARQPHLEATSDWCPEEGAFDVPVGRRVATIVEGANKRIRAMYQTVFARKLIASARTAVTRWSKKAGIPPPAPTAKAKAKAQAQAQEGKAE